MSPSSVTVCVISVFTHSLCGQSFGFGILLNMTHKQTCLDCKKPVCSHCCVEITNPLAKKYEACCRHHFLSKRNSFIAFSEASASVMSALKYVMFIKRPVLGSTKAFPTTSFPVVHMASSALMPVSSQPRP